MNSSVARLNSAARSNKLRHAWTNAEINSRPSENGFWRTNSLVPDMPFVRNISAEPSRFRTVQQVVNNHLPTHVEDREALLNKAISAVIVVNTITMGLETDLTNANDPAKDRIFWILLESIMIIIFTAEIVVRLYIERWHWPWSLWNWLDVCLVICAIMETWILNFMEESGRLRVVGLMRCVRMVRLVRVFRLLRMFSPLYTTVMAFKEALSGLAYIGAIMVGGIYVCAIFITGVVGRGDMRELDLAGITGTERFGSVMWSMYSLFELITLEGWVEVARPMVEHQPAMAIFFVSFICLFTFGLLQMVVAVVVEKTLMNAKKTQLTVAEKMQQKVGKQLERMREAFIECDSNQDKMIDRTEFAEAMEATPTGKLKDCFEALELPTHDALTLFDMLDGDASGQLNMEEFLNGVKRVLGASDPLWDHLATHALMMGLRKQFKEFHHQIKQNLAKRPKLMTLNSMDVLESWLPKPLTPPAWS